MYMNDGNGKPVGMPQRVIYQCSEDGVCGCLYM